MILFTDDAALQFHFHLTGMRDSERGETVIY